LQVVIAVLLNTALKIRLRSYEPLSIAGGDANRRLTPMAPAIQNFKAAMDDGCEYVFGPRVRPKSTPTPEPRARIVNSAYGTRRRFIPIRARLSSDSRHTFLSLRPLKQKSV
jgi:hypothetical protein